MHISTFILWIMYTPVILFTEVLKEFAAKKCVKLGNLLRETGVLGVQMKHGLNPSTLKVNK